MDFAYNSIILMIFFFRPIDQTRMVYWQLRIISFISIKFIQLNWFNNYLIWKQMSMILCNYLIIYSNYDIWFGCFETFPQM